MSSPTDSRPPGVLMIQIDALARPQLERALRQGRMPFLRRLLHNQGYQLMDHYSGLPSSTPAVQAEIFYKAKSAVPAFSYYDRDEGREFRMYQAECASAVADRARGLAEPLLRGGSSYSNIYCAGALRPHFCAQVFGPQTALRYFSPKTWASLLTTHLKRTSKVAWLGLMESGLAVSDAVRGSMDLRELPKETIFVPARVSICILLREIIRYQVMHDVEDGLPIVHCNLIGYDEQAHRRGPSSRFAHWTLRGIDNTVRDMVAAAERSTKRRYEVLIYSDHGQEDTIYYRKETGRDLGQVLKEISGEKYSTERTDTVNMYHERGRRMFAGSPRDEGPDPLEGVRLCSMGPLAQVYWPEIPSPQQKAAYARALTEQHSVPWALYQAGPDGEVRAVSAKTGDQPLAEVQSALCGPHHPFPEAVIRDLDYLVRTKQAGDLVLSGWRHWAQPMTFAHEHGSHAGPGRSETHGFVLVPPQIKIKRPYLRPSDLHDLAQHLRHQEEATARQAPRVVLRAPDEVPTSVNVGNIPSLERNYPTRRLRVMTYNVHHCQGVDLRLDLPRIARIIRRFAPDVVALQEVDVDVERSRRSDQPKDLAEMLGYHHAFLPVRPHGSGKYGIALLTRESLEIRQAQNYVQDRVDSRRELRGSLWIELKIDGRLVHVFNTHWGLHPGERSRQARQLLNSQWLHQVDDDSPLVVMGDFNALPQTQAYRLMAEKLRDAQLELPHHTPLATLPSVKPVARVDHIWLSPHWNVRAIARPTDRQTRLASDHLPLIVDLELKPS
ncbi:MAG: endonuclease/exonuclease/phosphatase family protein [Verrucomicrobiota bacterium JB022]|nr:endonuclease/exonuclease/phosphatase family protein [Verrucomicrobiota bacterium JB022]